MPINESVSPGMVLGVEPEHVPGLICFWSFRQSGSRFEALAGESYVLESQTGEINVVNDASAPFYGCALALENRTWLSCPRKDCPALDIHGPGQQLTVLAWIKRLRGPARGCEFIAGQWNETHLGRQYGLFINISVWQQQDQVCGHLSHVGGPTPGYRYCIDGPVGKSPVPWDEWSVVGMSYDGYNGYAWLNGMLDLRPGLNPYSLAGGLHDGGSNGSDFTVGAVDRSGEIGNFFNGYISGLAVYSRALTPAEIYVLSLQPKSRPG